MTVARSRPRRMTGAEWRVHAETAPATRNQVGAIRREFARLGFGEADRAERLRITAQLAQVPRCPPSWPPPRT